MDRTTYNEPRVFRRVALPVRAFDALASLKRAWQLPTNGDVLTRLLLENAYRGTPKPPAMAGASATRGVN